MRNDALTKLADIVFIATCAALIAFAAIKVRDGQSQSLAGSGNESAITTGTQANALPAGFELGKIEGVSFDTSALTVALVVQRTCPYCSASMGFYKRLSNLRTAQHFNLVALSAEPAKTTRDYLSAHGLVVDAVGALRGQEVPTSGTPTLVLVTRHGAVNASWIGQLSASQESAVIESIKKATM